MLDHVFTDCIAALRDVLEAALLEPQEVEERFHADVLLGDLSWQTTYSLPGEGTPPRVQADVLLEWSTWSQAAYRSWRHGDQVTDPPRVDVEIVLRIQRLRHGVPPERVLGVLPPVTPGPVVLERTTVRLETVYEPATDGDDPLGDAVHGVDVSYEGTYELDEATLGEPARLDEQFGAMGGWIASTLVRLGDLDLDFLPPDEQEHDEP